VEYRDIRSRTIQIAALSTVGPTNVLWAGPNLVNQLY